MDLVDVVRLFILHADDLAERAGFHCPADGLDSDRALVDVHADVLTGLHELHRFDHPAGHQISHAAKAQLAAWAHILSDTIARFGDVSGKVTETVLGRGDAADAGLIVTLQDFDRLQQEFAALSEVFAHWMDHWCGGHHAAHGHDPISGVTLADLKDREGDLHVFGSIGFLVGEVSTEARSSVVRARVYAGYSGWGPGQLEAEMAANAWILEPARDTDVFTDEPDLLWRRVLERKGEPYRRLAKLPYDPSMN